MSNKAKIFLLSIMSFLVGMSQFIIAGVLDQIALSLNISIASAGQLMSVYALSSAIGTPLLLMLMAKIDLRNQMIFALIVFIIGIFTLLVFDNYFFIVISRMVVGVGAGVFVVTAYAISARLAIAGQQGRAMASVAIGFSIALVFGVPLGRIISALFNWEMNFWLIGILSIVCLFVILKEIPKVTNVQSNITLKEQVTYFTKPYITTALFATLFFFVSFGMINTYITPFIFSIDTVSEKEMSVILCVLGIASFIGSKLAGSLSDKLGASKTLYSSMCVHFSAMMLLFFATHSILLSTFLLFIWMSASWTFGPSQSINLASIAPKASAMILGFNSSFVQLGFAVGGGIGGITITHFPIIALCGVGSVSVIVAFCFLRLSQKYLKTAT
ncbi:MAG: MFS transporter [Campylobacteraceae bacterium]